MSRAVMVADDVGLLRCNGRRAAGAATGAPIRRDPLPAKEAVHLAAVDVADRAQYSWGPPWLKSSVVWNGRTQ